MIGRQPASVDEVIASWVRAEFDSPRFSPALKRALEEAGASEELVREDLSDASRNEQRRKLLLRSRPELHDFPFDELSWTKAQLENYEEIGNLYTTTALTWLAFTDGEREVRLAAKFVLELPAGNDPRVHLIPIHQKIDDGQPIEPLILISSSADGTKPLVVIEGNVRAVAYFTSQKTSFPLEVYVGTAPFVARWKNIEDKFSDIKQAFLGGAQT